MPLNREQFGRIMRIYEDRRRRQAEELTARRNEIREKLPAYEQLERQRLDLSMQRLRLSLSPDAGGRLAEADARLAQLSRQKQQVLADAGYPADYLQLHYSCPLCRDSGFVNGEHCQCFKALMLRELYHDSPLWLRAGQENFESFDLELFDSKPCQELEGRSPRENMAVLFETALRFTEEFSEQKDSLLLTGPVGSGKTFLCTAMAGELLKKGEAVVYMSAAEYFDCMAQISFGEENGESFAEMMTQADLLVVDDLGMETPTRLVQSQLFRTVNERLLKKQATIISTNLSLNDIREKYGERVASRIYGGYRILRFAGRDLRLKKH